MSSSAMEVGKKLVAMCREGNFHGAIEALYSPDIVSIEPMSMGARPARIQGIQAVAEKGKWWVDNHTVHSSSAEGPYPHGDRFIVRFTMDVTPKAGPMARKRNQFEEAGLYTVKDGKVVQEEFFYGM